ncbi:MAG: delta-60 repeat domain-containing protein, partial [Verrucomicrobia bacterium]|nr:delta-60 repeat domain-containing protein [Verrucomicrobiota bacterium]
VAARTNGSVLIQGSFTSYNGTTRLGLARLNADGSLDTNFDPGSRAANLSALAWQPDGKVVFSGAFASLDGLGATNLARLNTDGSLDTNFTALASLNVRADTVVVQRDGKILLSGLFTSANGAPFNRLTRLHPDGNLDASFNPGAGLNLIGGPPAGKAIRSAEQPDGQLLVWGSFTKFNGTNRNGAVRLNPDGSFDPSFNPTEVVFYYEVDGVRNVTVSNLCFQVDCRILASYSRPFTGLLYPVNPPLLRRYRVDGSVDPTWMYEDGANGYVQTIVLQSDGKSVLGGEFREVNGVPRTALARLHPDGALDASFNPNLGSNAYVTCLALMSDGKVVVGGGFTNVNGVARTNLARLNPDGALDASFNPAFGPEHTVQTMVGQPNGQLLVSIYSDTDTGWRPGLLRLNTNGSLDTSFVVQLPNEFPGAIALQPDGKIVVSASVTNAAGLSRTNFARLNPDGSLDSGFNSGLGPDEWVSSVVLLSDGRLLVGGYFSSWNGVDRPGLVRLHPDGSLDETFASVLLLSSVSALSVQP